MSTETAWMAASRWAAHVKIHASGEGCCCPCDECPQHQTPEQRRLRAAAPEMYALADHIVDELGSCHEQDDHCLHILADFTHTTAFSLPCFVAEARALRARVRRQA